MINFMYFQLLINKFIALSKNPAYVAIPYKRIDSWKICHDEFSKAIANKKAKKSLDIDYLALILSEYLSSWGMRRNSFLLKLTYQVHKGAIEIILNDSYKSVKFIDLLDASTSDYLNNNDMVDALMDLKDKLIEYYTSYANNAKKSEQLLTGTFSSSATSVKLLMPSDTLISKILLGTLGCCVAYDSLVKKTLKNGGLASASFSKKSIIQLSKFYDSNKLKMDQLRKQLNNIPEMKLLDLGLWLLSI